MVYSDLLDMCMARATRLGLVANASGQPDAAELETYLFSALMELAETTDIPAYMVHDALMGTTEVGQPWLDLPAEFGRLILPRVRNKRGIFLLIGGVKTDLTYLDPMTLTRRTAQPRGIPEMFTVMAHQLWFTPTPDASYAIQGAYIKRMVRPELDDPVDLAYPTALVEIALFRLASDSGKAVQSLQTSRQEALTRLVMGSR